VSEQAAENDMAAPTLTDAERMKISAVVHQNYYMPDVFEVVEQIIHLRAFYAWEAGFAGGITAERGGRVQNPWARGRSLADGHVIAPIAPEDDEGVAAWGSPDDRWNGVPLHPDPRREGEST
jgi:hypothetical protein